MFPNAYFGIVKNQNYAYFRIVQNYDYAYFRKATANPYAKFASKKTKISDFLKQRKNCDETTV